MATHPEALLISSILRTGDSTTHFRKGITSAHFHLHKTEMEWIEGYIQKHRKAPSKVTFKSKFPNFQTYQADDVEHFSDEVKSEHVRWTLMSLLEDSIDLIAADDADQALKKLQAGLITVQSQTQGESIDFDLISDWETTYGEVSQRVDRVLRTGHAGIPTGFRTLDLVTGGLQPGWLCIVGARLGQGKTFTLIRMSLAAVALGHKVQFFSLEQGKTQISIRAMAFLSKQYGPELFKSMDLSRGRGFDIRAYRKFVEQLKDSVSGKFLVNDTSRGRVSPLTIQAACEKNQPDMVMVDYLTLMQMQGDGGWQSVAALSAALKGLGEQYQIPMIAGSQINRMGISKEPPGAEHLSQADNIGHDADLLITQMQLSKSVLKMKVAKFRHGPTGDVWWCKFKPNIGEFEEVSGDEAEVLKDADAEDADT
jgi:replicative DNA helicase